MVSTVLGVVRKTTYTVLLPSRHTLEGERVHDLLAGHTIVPRSSLLPRLPSWDAVMVSDEDTHTTTAGRRLSEVVTVR